MTPERRAKFTKEKVALLELLTTQTKASGNLSLLDRASYLNLITKNLSLFIADVASEVELEIGQERPRERSE